MRGTYYIIDGEQLPVDRYFVIGKAKYLFRVRKNKAKEYLTLEVIDPKTKQLIVSNKIVYGINLLDYIVAQIPEKIIPLNLDYEATGKGSSTVTTRTLGREILLFSKLE